MTAHLDDALAAVAAVHGFEDLVAAEEEGAVGPQRVEHVLQIVNVLHSQEGLSGHTFVWLSGITTRLLAGKRCLKGNIRVCATLHVSRRHF